MLLFMFHNQSLRCAHLKLYSSALILRSAMRLFTVYTALTCSLHCAHLQLTLRTFYNLEFFKLQFAHNKHYHRTL